MTGRVVAVPVATMWTSPEAPRPVDAPAVADEPDLAGWTAGMDADCRLGLHGRTLTQLERGEPVVVLEERDGWSRVVAPWQASSMDERGYPGWVRTSHLAEGPAAERPDAPAYDVEPVLGTARGFLGLPYLWGGTSSWGLDCSGLVHLCWREHGVLLPRDAHDQATAVEPVDLDDVRRGDLYFFARPGRSVYHVGFVTGPVEPDGTRWMLHAPEGGGIEDAPMAPHRVEDLVSAGRVTGRTGPRSGY